MSRTETVTLTNMCMVFDGDMSEFFNIFFNDELSEFFYLKENGE